MSESTITEDRVRDEHLKSVHVPAHWGYLCGVLLVGALLMIGLIALMAASAG